MQEEGHHYPQEKQELAKTRINPEGAGKEVLQQNKMILSYFTPLLTILIILVIKICKLSGSLLCRNLSRTCGRTPQFQVTPFHISRTSTFSAAPSQSSSRTNSVVLLCSPSWLCSESFLTSTLAPMQSFSRIGSSINLLLRIG